jgi:hypothetical protein
MNESADGLTQIRPSARPGWAFSERGNLDAASVTKKMRPVSRADAALKQRYKLRRVVLTAACEEFLRHAAD